MKRKTAVLLATVVLLATIGITLAANWHFSGTETTKSVDWLVTINSLPAESVRYQNITFTGTVYLGSTVKTNVLVTLWLNDTETLSTDLTNGLGEYSIQYNNTHAAGTILNFKAGVNQ